MVSLPDFKEEQQWVTHGETYQEALENAVEVMDMLVEIYQEKGKSLPEAEILYDSVARSQCNIEKKERLRYRGLFGSHFPNIK